MMSEETASGVRLRRNSPSTKGYLLLTRLSALYALIFATLALFISCKTDGGSLDPELEARLREIVSRYKEDFGIPGVLAGIWIPGRGHLIIENGLSDIDAGTPIDKADHVRIGSVTKSFTVTVILQLVGEGLISLNDPVGDYLPGVENGDATIAELANMKSGIFNYTEDADFVMEFVSSNFLRVWTNQELVDAADRNAPYFPPGGGWHYSNTNTVILGMIVEQVTGNSLGEEITDRILKPLGLDGTIYPATPRHTRAVCPGLWVRPNRGHNLHRPFVLSRLGSHDIEAHGLEEMGRGSRKRDTSRR